MSILKKPIVTEKVSAMNERGRYGFIVDKHANKIQIKNAIEKNYGVTVKSMNTMIYPGKVKSKLTKLKVISGRTNSFKKAIVTVMDGDIIDFYSGT